MGINIYHQVGHFDKWNIDSFVKDECGDGLILSPVHQKKTRIEDMSLALKSKSIFDPQYYLPNSQKQKLSSYPFFPEFISGGFSTSSFEVFALESARMCVQFQIDQGFEKIVIPARFFEQMASDYIQKQEEYTVIPFLQAIKEKNSSAKNLLTLPLTSHMVQDEKYRTNILNWLTSYPELHGVYILINHERPTKQILSEDYLYSLMVLLKELRDVELEVVVGHTNTESLLLTLIDDITVTFGSFENTRMFSIDKFVVSDEDRRGPKARIYIPGLMNWIQFPQAMEIRRGDNALWSEIYRETDYAEKTFKAALTKEPTFNQPNLYKHHFICFYEQFTQLKECSVIERYRLLRKWLKAGINNHNRVQELFIDLDKHGNDAHLQPWLNCINRFYRDFLKV